MNGIVASASIDFVGLQRVMDDSRDIVAPRDGKSYVDGSVSQCWLFSASEGERECAREIVVW